MIGALLLTPCSHRTCALLGCVCPPIVGRFAETREDPIPSVVLPPTHNREPYDTHY